MHKKIYFNQKPLFLCTTITQDINNYIDKKGNILIADLNDTSASSAIQKIQQPEVNGVVLRHQDIDKLFEAVAKEFTLIKAGGGFVHTADNEILLILRRGKWDLPKGKLDEGESIEQCAVREVEEETGLANLQLQQLLTITYHTYYEGATPILKESYWFMMYIDKAQPFVPQVEEDIEKCEWVKAEDMTTFLENTHPSIIDVVDAGIKQLHQAKEV